MIATIGTLASKDPHREVLCCDKGSGVGVKEAAARFGAQYDG
ncbi:MAG TPA: hypothetical protein VLA67_02420 [Nitrospiraceae bacterium]|nr:hypothetical protein [Nitrospiraceae bacterium]